MADVKELTELIAGVKEVALLAKAVMKDGKVDLADIGVLGQLLAKQAEIQAAFDGVALVKEELKDMDLAEAKLVVNQLLDAAAEVKAA